MGGFRPGPLGLIKTISSEPAHDYDLCAGIPQKNGKIDYGMDFFAPQAFLTVSGQLQVETFACAVSSVYTFGPTFRAENFHTLRHLTEFWMVEPEIAFTDLKDDMNCAEAYVKFLCNWLLENCLDDMEFMAKNHDKSCIDRLRMAASTPFERVSYSEAVDILIEVVKGVKHSRFGLDFERMVLFATGMENIRDVIPFHSTQVGPISNLAMMI